MPAVPAEVKVFARPGSQVWRKPASREPSFLSGGVPQFLNQIGSLSCAADWDRADVGRLWRYNLHYLDDLNARGSKDRVEFHRELIDRWIEENPPATGTGWEPYPCSLRIVNIIKWALAGNELRPTWASSLAMQAEWLSRNVEWHLLGNHLFANAKALIFAGCFFDGPSTDKWLEDGLSIVSRELSEQVLGDGGQFERSPMYHSLALEDMLDLINLAENYPALFANEFIDEFRRKAEQMLFWQEAMPHPDGEISLLNDSAFQIAPNPNELRRYSQRLGLPSFEIGPGLTALRETGYFRAQNQAAVLIADLGEIGPDYLPGHAHADTLSFELSLFDQRWFVDTGCSMYEYCEERLRQRGTRAHNTVVVDGKDSSEVWASFRVARRARPLEVDANESEDGISIMGAHSGYHRLRGHVTHSRSFELYPLRLKIFDHLDGRFDQAEANFLLHPEVQVELSDGGFLLRRSDHKARLVFHGGAAELQTATWHPEFGKSLSTHRISVAFRSSRLESILDWSERQGRPV